MKWISEMKKLNFIKENFGPPETFAKAVEASNAENVDYDTF